MYNASKFDTVLTVMKVMKMKVRKFFGQCCYK